MKSLILYFTLCGIAAGQLTPTFKPVGSNGEQVNASPFLTALGGTTAGKALFQMANPGAVRYLRINGDNTVSQLDASTFLSAIGGGASSFSALTGQPSDNANLASALNLKAPLVSPSFTSPLLGNATASSISVAAGGITTAYGTFTANSPGGNATMTSNGVITASGNITGANLSGTNTGDNSVNTTYASDFRAANFVAGTNYLAPNGSGAALTNLDAANLTTGTVNLARLVNTQTVGDADATITAGTRDVLLTAITAARTYTLPLASAYPAGSRVSFVDMANVLTSTNTATLARSGSDLINGATSYVLSTPGAAPLLISDGVSRWNMDIRGVARGGTGAITQAGARANLGLGKVDNLSVAAPVDVLPNKILIRDLFDGPSEIQTAAAGTRNASPGPGIMTAVGSPGVSQVLAGKNALMLTRNPSNAGGGTAAIRYDGVTAGPGLTMIVRMIPAMTGRYAPEFYGFSLVSTALESQSAGSFFVSNGGGASTEGLNLFMIPRDTSMTVVPDFVSFADFGQLISLAVKYESATRRSYWVQGGSMAESFGCHNYSNNWMQVGEETAATAIADGTIVYPFVSKPQYSGGAAVVREVCVLSDWSPSPRHGGLDFKAGGVGVHCPTVNHDPVTGLLVTAWNNGTTHENVDSKINARVRLADGSWGALQTVVAALGTPAIMNVGTLSKVNGALWLTYWRNPSGGGGGTLYRRTVSVNAATGVITMGGETTLGITGTDNLASGPMLTLSTGRILQAYHNSAINSQVARSDDNGITWTSTAAFTRPTATGNYLAEPCLVLESAGAVGCYLRTAGSTVFYCRSTDNGVTWTTPVPIYNLPSFGRSMAKNMTDGSIFVMGCNSKTQRRFITGWRMGDNGVVLGEMRLGDLAISGSGGTTFFQYPDFVQDGDTLFYAVSQQGPQGSGSCIKYHQREWSGDLELAYELAGSPKPVKSSVNVWPDSNLFLGPKGGNVVVLVSGASVATPCKLADNFQLTLGTNVTLSAPTNPLPWQRCTWVFIQNSTPQTLTLDAMFETAPYTITLPTASGAHAYMEALWNPEKGKWQVVNFSSSAGYNVSSLNVTGTSTFTGGVVGVTNGSNATAGNVGEAVNSLIPAGSAVALTNATSTNVTSISLTAGDWIVTGNINFAGTSATYSGAIGGISTTTATVPTDGTETYSGAMFTLLTATDGVTLTSKRVNVTTSTTVYLVAKPSFSAGTVAGFGSISARRIFR